MDTKLHYKMYKVGKKWVFAPVMSLSIFVGGNMVQGDHILANEVISNLSEVDGISPKGQPTGDDISVLWGTVIVGSGISKQPESRNIGVNDKTGKLTVDVRRSLGTIAANTAVGWLKQYVVWYTSTDGKNWVKVGDKNDITIDTSKLGTRYYQASVQYGNFVTGGAYYWSDVAKINVTEPVAAKTIAIESPNYLLNKKGASIKNKAIIAPNNYTGEVIWSIDTTNYATIDTKTGILTAKEGAVGWVTVTALAKNHDGTFVTTSKRIKVGSGLENKTTFVGEETSFKIEGVSNVEEVAIQWYKNGQPIGGLTNSTKIDLDVANTQKSNNGDVYSAEMVISYIDETGQKNTSDIIAINGGKNPNIKNPEGGKLTVVKPFGVLIEFIDENGVKIHDSVVDGSDYKAGDSYDVDTSKYDIEGYTFEKVSLNGDPLNGTFPTNEEIQNNPNIDGNKRVVLQYKKNMEDRADKDLQDTKDSGKQEVDGLENLTPEQKEEAKKNIDGAVDQDAVNKIVEDAKQQLPNTESSENALISLMGIMTMFSNCHRK